MTFRNDPNLAAASGRSEVQQQHAHGPLDYETSGIIIQKTASNPLPIGSNLAAINPYLGDRDALDAAIAIVRRHRERWQEFLNLAQERGWQEAAAIAAYDAQCRSMRLPPWELPPCMASVRGKGRAFRLLRRMLRRGISRWHPRPFEAIAEATKR